MKSYIVFLFLVWAVHCPCIADSTVRTWTAEDGRTVEARYIEMKGGKVLISRTSDGERFIYPLANLSSTDQEWVHAFEEMRSTAIDATFRVLQVLEDGVLAEGSGFRGPEKTRTVRRTATVPGTGLNSHTTETKTWEEVVKEREQVLLKPRVFIRCDTDGLIDGSIDSKRIWPAGTYKFTTVMGAPATVAAYTAFAPEL